MNNNKDNNTEAVKIANALKPFVKNWFNEWGQSCMRSKKMTVTTAPNGSVIGVTDAFSDTEIFIKYMSSCANAIVGDTVWCNWMYDNMQTLYADRVTFDDTVVSESRYSHASLSSAGWYRVLEFSPSSEYASYDLDGAIGALIHFYVTRRYYWNGAETHKIDLSLVNGLIMWKNEYSNSSVFGIDKIRYTKNTSTTKGYVDIHYTLSQENQTAVTFNVDCPLDPDGINYNTQIKSKNLVAVSDAPSGETIVSEYSFSKNCHDFGYQGYAKLMGTDFNSITKAGIYYLDDTTMSNAPSDYKWGYLLVLTNLGTHQITQMVIYVANSTRQRFSTRSYTGSPAYWTSWYASLDNNYGNLMETGHRPYTDGSEVSIATSTWKSVCSLTLSAGRWLVYATGRFNNNANGTIRGIRVGTSADSSGGATVQFTDYRPPVTNNYTYCKSVDMAILSSQTTYYLNAYQNTGSDLGVVGRLYAVRIA